MMSARCHFCGHDIPFLPVPKPEEHNTHCLVLRARKGVIVPCNFPVNGSLQLGCEWPGGKCPRSAAFDKAKEEPVSSFVNFEERLKKEFGEKMFSTVEAENRLELSLSWTYTAVKVLHENGRLDLVQAGSMARFNIWRLAK